MIIQSANGSIFPTRKRPPSPPERSPTHSNGIAARPTTSFGVTAAREVNGVNPSQLERLLTTNGINGITTSPTTFGVTPANGSILGTSQLENRVLPPRVVTTNGVNGTRTPLSVLPAREVTTNGTRTPFLPAREVTTNGTRTAVSVLPAREVNSVNRGVMCGAVSFNAKNINNLDKNKYVEK